MESPKRWGNSAACNVKNNNGRMWMFEVDVYLARYHVYVQCVFFEY